MNQLKFLNRDLNLRLIKKKTLQSIFKILLNESNIKSRELDLHNRFIFDFFFKSTLYNSNFSAILLKDRFYSFNFYRRSQLFYFFFNTGVFLDLKNEYFKYLQVYLFNSKKYISIFFNNVLNFRGMYVWSFNISFFNLFSFLEDISFLETQKKEFLHEEGKKLFIREFFISRIFFIKLFQRKYHFRIFKDIFSFYQNIKLLKKYLGFNILYFSSLFIFIFHLYLFILYYIFSMFCMFDFFFKNLIIIKND